MAIPTPFGARSRRGANFSGFAGEWKRALTRPSAEPNPVCRLLGDHSAPRPPRSSAKRSALPARRRRQRLFPGHPRAVSFRCTARKSRCVSRPSWHLTGPRRRQTPASASPDLASETLADSLAFTAARSCAGPRVSPSHRPETSLHSAQRGRPRPLHSRPLPAGETVSHDPAGTICASG